MVIFWGLISQDEKTSIKNIRGFLFSSRQVAYFDIPENRFESISRLPTSPNNKSHKQIPYLHSLKLR